MINRYLFIQTIGCQMNVNDSESILQTMKPLGYTETSSLEKADVILLNTCSIREKAEQKTFSFLGRLAKLKRKKPELVIGMGGCVAQQEGEKALRRVPYIDLVFGTHAINRLPGMIERVIEKRCRIVDVELSRKIEELEKSQIYYDEDKPCRFVTIMRGCDNFCAYCVVPYVRGRETSRHPDHILKEIQSLADEGVREVTLLGQNVNSYGKKEGLCSFPELLFKVNDIDGLRRIRFTTSHPKDLSDGLIDAFKQLEKLCNHIHLPVQSGSDRILAKMNRRYTKDQYLYKIDKLRTVCPDIGITSDFIVGFPGETEKDFDETLALIQTVKFDGVFAFNYSDRPNTPAKELSSKVLESDKKYRLQALFDCQAEITLKKNKALIGSTVPVLIEGRSKKQDAAGLLNDPNLAQWTGRTPSNKIVNFVFGEKPSSVEKDILGKIVDIHIQKAFPHSLWGKNINKKIISPIVKGENSYAA
jgi:tRNA-2-methylthio-N6-dimethylallyladenosine synthase